jgi:polyamine oxidase
LFATVLAEEAYRVERLSDEETQAEIMAVLRQMFPGTTIPEPAAFFYPGWSKAEWAYGRYSNWPLGVTLEMQRNLRANT